MSGSWMLYALRRNDLICETPYLKSYGVFSYP